MKFTLRTVSLKGASAISTEQLSSAWSGYLGHEIAVSTLYEVVNEITRRYSQAGYALSFALLPEQRISDGNVTIAIIEGFVSDVVIAGTEDDDDRLYGFNRAIRAQAERIKASRPLKTAVLERALLLINDLPGLHAQAVFASAKNTPNGSVLTMSVTRDIVGGTLSMDNRMKRDLGRWRAGGSVQFNGFVTGSDRLEFQAYHGFKGDSFGYGSAAFEQQLTTSGIQLSLSTSYSTDVPASGVLKSLDFDGQNLNAVIEVSYPIIRSRPQNLNIGLSVEYQDSKTRALGTTLTQDEIRFLDAWGVFDYADSTGAVSLARLSLQQGLDILGATSDASLVKSRASGSASFTTLGMLLQRDQPVFDEVSVYGRLSSQAALGDPLLASNECSYGGQSFGRAYDAGALSGDHCVEGSVEMRLTYPWEGFGLQLYGFADAGVVVQKGHLEPGEVRTEQAASAGGGLRVQIDSFWNFAAEIGVPLREQFSEKGSGDPRAFFSASTHY